MSDRICVELYNPTLIPDKWERCFIFYRHWGDDEIGKELEKVLNQAHKQGRWWQSQYLVTDLMKAGFELTTELHTDICGIWRVYLGREEGKYEIKYFNAIHSRQYGTLDLLKEIDWKN